jgi:hypothetical protein
LAVEISLDQNANIDVHALGDDESASKFSAWFKQAEPEVLWDNIISSVFQTVENDLPKIDWQQVLGVSLPENELKMSSAKVSVYLNESPNQVVQGYEIILSQKCHIPKLNGKTLTVPMLLILQQDFVHCMLIKILKVQLYFRAIPKYIMRDSLEKLLYNYD